MKVKKNVELKKMTTLKIGGKANELIFLEKEKDVYQLDKEDLRYILGGGSNLLINDRRVFDRVISTRKLKEKISFDNSTNVLDVSAGYTTRELINFMRKLGLGGIEYLFNVPATVGGAVMMNAGEGHGGDSIMNYCKSVKIFDGEKMIEVGAEEIEVGYRYTSFQDLKNHLIISVKFEFEKRSDDEIAEKIKSKLDYVRLYQDIKKPNLGSVFSVNNHMIMKILKKIQLGYKDGIHYSNKTDNWLSNGGKGTFKQAKKIIFLTGLLHRIFFKDVKLEWKIWS